jgi:hypothetical protein
MQRAIGKKVRKCYDYTNKEIIKIGEIIKLGGIVFQDAKRRRLR